MVGGIGSVGLSRKFCLDNKMHNISSKLEIDIWEERRKTKIESSK